MTFQQKQTIAAFLTGTILTLTVLAIVVGLVLSKQGPIKINHNTVCQNVSGGDVCNGTIYLGEWE